MTRAIAKEVVKRQSRPPWKSVAELGTIKGVGPTKLKGFEKHLIAV